MDGMGDMNMGGMDSGSASMFKPTNMRIARIFWYLIAALVSFVTIRRVSRHLWNIAVMRRYRRHRCSIPSRPTNPVTQTLATATAILREMSYPQPLYFSGRLTRFISPPSAGRCLLLVAYWIMILVMLLSNTILSPSSTIYAYKWEIVGFRAAWVSVTQLPLVYLLSCKINPVSILSGISYERLNWIHRWTARTLFLTVTVHWAFFYREWDLAQLVSLELEMMTMVKYGFGAWGVLGWLVLSGFGFFRHAHYEIFVLQHIAAAILLLWLVYLHVPNYATYNVWLSVGFLALDWTARMTLAVWRNVRTSSIFGFQAEVNALGDSYMLLTIKDVSFAWEAGQHLYISIPRFGIWQNHPFTIANSCSKSPDNKRSVRLYIRAQSGMTKRLYEEASRQGLDGSPRSMRIFINGPLGTPPSLSNYDTVAFVATSTGLSFTLPLFERICCQYGSATRRIHFHWIVRHMDQSDWYQRQLNGALEQAKRNNIDATVIIHVTAQMEAPSEAPFFQTTCLECKAISSTSRLSTAQDFVVSSIGASLSSESSPCLAKPKVRLCSCGGRPTLDAILRPPIEQALGETAVIGCGPLGFTADMRNYVTSISDERAVHKGTGAQGIFLFTETYGW